MNGTQIVVVEDENIVAKDIQNRLERLGYGVPAVASSGEEAIELVPREQPDLVLMDVMLRGEMRGTEAAETIRTRFDIPVIYLTAYSDPDTLERAKVTGPHGYLLKPFDEQDLQTAIEMALYKHKMEQTLKAQKDQLSTILLSIGDGVITVDGKGAISLMNLAAEDMTGWTQDQAVGQPLEEVVRVDQADPALTPAGRVKDLLEGGSASGAVGAVLRTQDGKDVPVEHTVNVMAGSDTGPEGAVLVLRDVSKRQKAEKEREKLKSQLAEAQKLEAIGHLTTGIAHNFGNALNVVLGNLELGLMYEPPERIKGLLETAKKACLGAADIVEGLRQFTSERQIVKSRVAISRLVQEAIEMCGQSFDPSIEQDLSETGREAAVVGDGAQLARALMSLCLNARDAVADVTEEGYVPRILLRVDEVRAKAPRERESGRFICIEVTDNGIGMDEKDQSHIFEPFFTTKEVGKGTGLGLTASYGIVEEHGGWIDFSSESGSGSTFRIYLPTAHTAEAEETSEAAGDLPGGSETVLIIDDDPLLGNTARKILEAHGYTVLAAESGPQGLAIHDREQVDLIVLDMSMPRMSGGDVLETLLDKGQDTRVVVISGYAPRIAESMGVRGYLKKPFQARDLLVTVRQALDDDESPPT